jgi:RNA polymerase sigma-70 factor (ECF subfamily)
MVSIDAAAAERRYERALHHDQTPERLYERQWGLAVLAGVLEDLRDDYAASGRRRLFDRLARFLTREDDAGTYAESARELGMTEGAVKVAVHRLRTRYREALRERVAATVASESEVEDELRYLLRTIEANDSAAS